MRSHYTESRYAEKVPIRLEEARWEGTFNYRGKKGIILSEGIGWIFPLISTSSEQEAIELRFEQEAIGLRKSGVSLPTDTFFCGTFCEKTKEPFKFQPVLDRKVLIDWLQRTFLFKPSFLRRYGELMVCYDTVRMGRLLQLVLSQESVK